MKFKITASSLWSTETDKLLKEYPCLHDFGYEVEETTEYSFYHNLNYPKKTAYIHINSLEELVKFKQAVDKIIIFDEDEIEIYDAWRE